MLNRRAFTLIELLVVIAIIAILAAILFPVFARAKEAAKSTAVLSSVKQLGTASNIYLADSDDVLPLTAVMRPLPSTTLGVGLLYPFPQNVINTATWQLPQRINMAQCFWVNSTYAYTKNFGIFDVQSNSSYPIPGDTYVNMAVPPRDGLEPNGILNHLSASMVTSPSTAVMLWPGSGNVSPVGRASANPSLNCLAEPCQFNPSGDPSADPDPGQGDFATQGGATLFCMTLTADSSSCQESEWIFGTHHMPIVRVDSSAKSVPVGSAVTPAYVNSAGAYSDPASQVTASGQLLGWWDCDANGNTDPPYNSKYPCYFRPDRTK